MGSLELPSKSSRDLHLVPATAEELDVQERHHSVEWKGALSLEAYLRREKHLYNQDLTKDGGQIPWMLVYQPDADGPRRVLCGCETLRKRGLVAREGKVEEVVCYGVASVFCPPDNRGKGYAGRMISELGEKLKNFEDDKGNRALFSVLFSDIGKDFYAARGWKVFPSTHISLPAADKPHGKGVKLLQSSDLPELCALDESIIRQRMGKLTSGRTTVAVVPDHRTAAWHHAREDFVCQELYGKTPSVKGALVGEKPGSRVWAYWTRIWANPDDPHSANTLHILRLVIEDDSMSDLLPASSQGAAAARDTEVARAISAILAVAQSEAGAWDMKEVQLWNPASATLAAAQLIDPAATVTERETESITSLRWYGEGSWENVDWICNEKYEWC